MIDSGNPQNRQDKISRALSEKLLGMGENEKTPVLVWFDGADLEPAREAALEKIGMTADAFETLIVSDYQAEPGNDIVQEYITAKRTASSEIYRRHNAAFAAKWLGGEEITFTSLFSPVVVTVIGAAKARSLNESDDVLLMDLADVEGKDFFDVSKPVVRADTAQTNYSVTGSGVRIGMVESGVPIKTNPGLSGANITTFSAATPPPATDHASLVAEIMVGKASGGIPSGVAHGAALYSRAVSGGDFYDAVEWLLSPAIDVNVINISWGDPSILNTYDTPGKWLDHIAFSHDVHVVCAGGNEGAFGIASPSMSHNAVTVGNLDDNNMVPLNDDKLAPSSPRFTSLLPNHLLKPDITAPGTKIMSAFFKTGSSTVKFEDTGTSFAAPLCDRDGCPAV